MKYGFVFPGGEARTAAEYAQQAEAAGWNGFFVWEPVWGTDAWVTLTAAAMVTNQIRLGTMLSPISRMRPWKLASETATLDRLSNGRVILSVGLGAVDTGFKEFGEVTERKTRAELMDEGLEILTGLWQGQPFRYDGKHYKIEETNFFPPPPPIQQPRIPVWVVGVWRREKSMSRVLRYDGILPGVVGEDGAMHQAMPHEIQQIRKYVDEQRRDEGTFDIIVEGETPGNDPEKASEMVGEWEAAGATWWIEAMWSSQSESAVLQRIRQGPPRI